MKEQEYERNAKDKTQFTSSVQLFIDKPIGWSFAQVIAILGMVMIAFPLFNNSIKRFDPNVLLFDIPAVALLYLAFIILKKSRAIGVSFDVFADMLIVERSTFFRDTKTERYNTRSIRQIIVDEKMDSDFDKMYQLQLELEDRSCVPLTTAYVYTSESLSQKTEILREVIYGSAKNLERLLMQKKKADATPLTVLIVVFFVLATPFGAHAYSRLGNLPRITVATGVPTSDAVNLVREKAAGILESDEKVLWVGQPQLGREGEVKGGWTMGFAYIWTLFSIFWCFAAIGFKWKNIVHPFHALMLLFGLPFVGIGFTLLLLPYFTYKDELETIYVVTDRAAIQIIGSRAFNLARFDSKSFGPLKVTEYMSPGSSTTDRADVMFMSSVDEDGNRSSYDGFWGVSDYKNVITLLQTNGVDRVR
ncbi:MAG: hypothetical protein K2X93_18635 [Candidatus Obscuribacterales bacterium]|nr:hypothetical protein [Candidatus Obscuribacterales bacterium]